MRIRKDNKDLMENEILLIADVSDALAHPLRVKILKYIMTQNRAMKTVCTKDLVEEFGYAQATISQHMKKLVLSGLVESKHKEKFSYYRTCGAFLLLKKILLYYVIHQPCIEGLSLCLKSQYQILSGEITVPLVG